VNNRIEEYSKRTNKKGTSPGRPFFITASIIKNAILDLLYPPRCVSCGRWMGSNTSWLFCDDCKEMLEFISEPYCAHCGIALVEESESSLCPRCENEADLPPGLTLRSLMRFDGPIQEMLHAVKYRQQLMHWPFGISAALVELLPLADRDRILITSVPLHRNKLRERGFNLPDNIAATMARKAHLPFKINLIERVRDTESQVGKTRPERLANMSGAFRFLGKVPASDRLIIIVDDVITTGATMAAAAEPFLANGNRVLGISPARAY